MLGMLNQLNLTEARIGGMPKISNICEEYLHISSSGSDPFGGDNEDEDPK